MVTASAPGKLHLIGEHAVVYGEPAIIAAVGLRTRVKVSRSDEVRYIDSRFGHDTTWTVEEVKKTAQHAKDLWERCNAKKDFSELIEFVKSDRYIPYRKAICGIALEKLGIRSGVTIEIDSDIPVGAGMGSSAAMHVALVKAIAEEYGKRISLEENNEIAFELEKLIHGTPSGGDNSASAYGGMIWFEKAQPNIIRPLDLGKLENFAAVHTVTPKKTTGELVQMVRNLDEKYRTQRVKEIGRMAHEMVDVLRRKDTKRLKEIMNATQDRLADLGVSVKEIDKIAFAVRDIGGAAKLCGAGGGGMMLCYNDDAEELKNTIRSLGFESMEIELGVEGVRLE